MNNEVRKPPRDVYYIETHESIKGVKGPNGLQRWPQVYEMSMPATICVREVLPGDDSIRVSREDWETIKQIMVPSAISVSRKLTDPYGIIERIERESKGE